MKKHPAVRTTWSHRRVAVSCSIVRFVAGYPLILLRHFYAIFAWKDIEIRGLMCFRIIEKYSVYQALSAFMEKH